MLYPDMNLQKRTQQNTTRYRTALYLRLSREDGDKTESDSIANQRTLLEAYAADHPELCIVDEFVDDGYSGSNFERPAFQNLFRELEQGTINCILVKDLSRFGRNYIEVGRYLERIFPVMRVRLIAVTDNYDSQSAWIFPGGGDPCGKSVRVDSTYYTVVGVDYRSGNGVNFGGRADETITIPQTVLRTAYNRGTAIDIIATTGKPGVVMSNIAQRMRETIARAHNIDPSDEKGIMVFNTEVLFQMLDNLFKGVNFLIWLVGIGTLLAGAIGVSNIMMVTVKERTTEIGIRRAIGATPKMILSQIISESILLTLVAGMSGIIFGVAILQMLEMANTTDGILTAHFQVDFWTAISSAILICILGGLAGLAPAWRAMSIKPVDAMRDE